MNPSHEETIAEQLPVLCSLDLQCWARLRTVSCLLRNVNIPTVKAIRVDCIHANLAARAETSWRYAVPLDEWQEKAHRYYKTEREICISDVHVPKAYPGVVDSKHLSVPVQCTVNGNTCWYRLVAISLGEARCEACSPYGKHRVSSIPRPYAELLQAVYTFSEPWVEAISEEQLPHVFFLLSPRGEPIDFEFRQFESMVMAECCLLSDNLVFTLLGQAIHNPVAAPFPLMLQEPCPEHHTGHVSAHQNLGLTTKDIQCIEANRMVFTAPI